MATTEAEASSSGRIPSEESVYDGFISYSHAADDLLAPRLQAGLQRFAKPWWKRRALRLFRDEASLSANPHLWSSITEALDDSAWFVLLLSPDAASSPWVNNEVEYWLEHKDADRIIPVVTGGDFGWDNGDVTGNAVPSALQGAFVEEPRWVDLRFGHGDEQLDLKNPAFAGAVADVASALRGIPKDELQSEEVKQHRRTRRTAWAVGISLLILATASVVFGIRADQQTQLAEASRLATASINVLREDPELALLLAISSADRSSDLSFEQTRALHAAIDRHRSIALIKHPTPNGFSTEAKLSPDGSMVVIDGQQRAPLVIRSVDTGELLWTLESFSEDWAFKAAFSADGRYLGVEVHWLGYYDLSIPELPSDPSPEGLYLYDAQTFELVSKASEPECSSTIMSLEIVVGSVWPSLIPRWCLDTGDWWLVDPVAGTTIAEYHEDADIWLLYPSSDGETIHLLTSEGEFLIDRETGERWALPAPPGSLALISSTGKFLQYGDRLADPLTGETLVDFDDAPESLEACWYAPTFTADDALVAYGCPSGSIYVFETSTGKRISTMTGHSGWVFDLGFDLEGRLLTTGAADGFVRVWSLDGAGEVRTIDVGDGYKADGGIDVHGETGVALLYPSEEETLFSGTVSMMERFAVGELVVFDIPSGSLRDRIPGVAGKVAKISPDGSLVAVQSADETGVGNIKLIDMESGEALYDLPGLCAWEPPSGDQGHCGDLIAADATDLAWSPDGSLLAMAGGSARAVAVWDVSDRRVIFVSPPSERFAFPYSAVAFSPNGSLLAVSSKSGMSVYDTNSWELVTPFITHTGRPSWVMHFTPDGTELVTAQAHSGDVRIYNTTTWDERNMQGGPAQTRDMALSSSGSLVALVDKEGSIHLLDFETGELIELISLDNRDITNVEFVDDDRHLLITSSTGPIEIITLDHAELVEIARSRISRTFTSAECEFYDLDPCPTLEEIRAG